MGGPRVTSSANTTLRSARRDVIVLTVLITAVMLLIWNGSTFFHRLPLADSRFGPDIRIASTALTLNVALILFGWRRYVDLQHEAEMRAEQERRATVLATTDPITGLYNRKGFADRAGQLCADAGERGDHLVVISFQVHRFKLINDQHGYETGDRLLKTLSVALADALGSEAVIARLGSDEFAVALALAPDDMSRADALAETVLQTVTRPLLFEERIIQVGAFAGIASTTAGDARIPDILRRADIAMDHARTGRVARPVWFDAGMERALIAHGEIEQGIRFGLEHGQFVPLLRAAGRPQHRRDRRLRGAGALDSPAFGRHRPGRVHPDRRGNRTDRPLVRPGDRRSPAPGGKLGPGDQDFGQHLAVPARRRLARAADRQDAGRDRFPRRTARRSKSPKARCSPTSTSRGASSPASRTRASGLRSTISAPASRRSRT